MTSVRWRVCRTGKVLSVGMQEEKGAGSEGMFVGESEESVAAVNQELMAAKLEGPEELEDEDGVTRKRERPRCEDNVRRLSKTPAHGQYFSSSFPSQTALPYRDHSQEPIESLHSGPAT